MAAGDRSGIPGGPVDPGPEGAGTGAPGPAARGTAGLPRTERGIGEALSAARSRAGLSFRELGRLSKVPPATLQPSARRSA